MTFTATRNGHNQSEHQGIRQKSTARLPPDEKKQLRTELLQLVELVRRNDADDWVV